MTKKHHIYIENRKDATALIERYSERNAKESAKRMKCKKCRYLKREVCFNFRKNRKKCSSESRYTHIFLEIAWRYGADCVLLWPQTFKG